MSMRKSVKRHSTFMQGRALWDLHQFLYNDANTWAVGQEIAALACIHHMHSMHYRICSIH